MSQPEVEEAILKSAVHEPLNVCVLDDEAPLVEMLVEMIDEFGFSATGTSDPKEVLNQISSGRCRVVLCDIYMPTMNGLTFLSEALAIDPGVYVILMTGAYSFESAIDAIKQGAYDYLPKPILQARLQQALTDLDEEFQRRRRIHELDQQLARYQDFDGVIGRSPGMIEVFDVARKIAKHYTNVLLTGATGTGKELIAQAIHGISPVAGNRFVICNCSAFVDTLLESELFGHERGSFTGATERRTGLFEYANGGTVFLDEVGETSLAMQAKLLRVIQNREIQRVGSSEVRHVEVRLIAATNRDLAAEVAAGRFREDLFYRLNTIQICLPSLKERLQDIPLLLSFFLKKYNLAYHKDIRGLTRRAQNLLMQHSWPGNIRELENAISSAALLVQNELIDIGDLPDRLRKRPETEAKENSWRPLPLDEVREDHIRRVLDLCHGNRVQAAQMLKIGRTSLYRFINRQGEKTSTSLRAKKDGGMREMDELSATPAAPLRNLVRNLTPPPSPSGKRP